MVEDGGSAVRAARPADYIEPVHTSVRGSDTASQRVLRRRRRRAPFQVRQSRTRVPGPVSTPPTPDRRGRPHRTPDRRGAGTPRHRGRVGQADDLTAHDDRATARLERPVHDYRRPCHGSGVQPYDFICQLGSRPKGEPRAPAPLPSPDRCTASNSRLRFSARPTSNLPGPSHADRSRRPGVPGHRRRPARVPDRRSWRTEGLGRDGRRHTVEARPENTRMQYGKASTTAL